MGGAGGGGGGEGEGGEEEREKARSTTGLLSPISTGLNRIRVLCSDRSVLRPCGGHEESE